MTTVGYGDVVPVTLEGRIAATVLMILGISLFAGITATITSFLLATDRPLTADPLEQLARLADLRASGAINEAEYEGKKAELLARV